MPVVYQCQLPQFFHTSTYFLREACEESKQTQQRKTKHPLEESVTSVIKYLSKGSLRKPAAVYPTTCTHAEASCLSTASCEVKEPPHIYLH